MHVAGKKRGQLPRLQVKSGVRTGGSLKRLTFCRFYNISCAQQQKQIARYREREGERWREREREGKKDARYFPVKLAGGFR